jgi:hypothetical protein
MRQGISRFAKAYDRISGRTLWGAILSHAYGLVQFYRLPRLPAGFKNTYRKQADNLVMRVVAP